MLDLAIVILNFNTRDLLRECLRSVYANTGLAFHVCVVDNGSADGSLDMVRAEFPQAAVVASSVNGGYSYGNNLGLRFFGFPGSGEARQTPNNLGAGAARPGTAESGPAGSGAAESGAAESGAAESGAAESGRARAGALPRYAMLLNPDTLVPAGALAALVRFMDEHARAGVCGPRLVLPDGRLDLACRRGFPTPEVSFYHMIGLSRLFPHSPRFGRYNMTFLDESQTAQVDSVVGACMLVRREALAQAGLMDETFFMYGEDLDWSKRIKEHGWQVFYDSDVVIHHVKRAASRHSRKAQVEFYRAMVIFYRKHYRASTPWWLHSLVLLGISLKGGLALTRDALRRPLVPPGVPPGAAQGQAGTLPGGVP